MSFPVPRETSDMKRQPGKISLLLADVDGTLVTHEKVLTERAAQAVVAMEKAGIRFAITSGAMRRMSRASRRRCSSSPKWWRTSAMRSSVP